MVAGRSTNETFEGLGRRWKRLFPLISCLHDITGRYPAHMNCNLSLSLSVTQHHKNHKNKQVFSKFTYFFFFKLMHAHFSQPSEDANFFALPVKNDNGWGKLDRCHGGGGGEIGVEEFMERDWKNKSQEWFSSSSNDNKFDKLPSWRCRCSPFHAWPWDRVAPKNCSTCDHQVHAVWDKKKRLNVAPPPAQKRVTTCWTLCDSHCRACSWACNTSQKKGLRSDRNDTELLDWYVSSHSECVFLWLTLYRWR